MTEQQNQRMNEINELFKLYKVTNTEKKLFIQLKKATKDLVLNDEELLSCIIAKKTFKKSLTLAKNFSSVIKEFNFGRVELKVEHLELMSKCYFWSDPRIKGSNGEIVMFVKASEFGMTGKDVVENEKLIMDSHFMFFSRLFLSNPDALRKGIIICSDMRGMNIGLVLNKEIWKMKKRTSPIMNKIPLRLKKYIMFHPPWYIKTIMVLVKAVMSKKLQKRICTANKPEDIIPKYISGLPEEMGGDFKFDRLEGLRRVIVKSKKDEEIFNQVMFNTPKKNKKKEKENNLEEVEGEEED